MGQKLFEAVDITCNFGPVCALDRVNLDICVGEIHAIVGENGAGKSTLMNVFCGRLNPNAGTLKRNGSIVKFHSSIGAQKSSIAISPQEICLVPELSVAENILLGSHNSSWCGRIDWRETNARAANELARLDNSIDPQIHVAELPKAQQQLVQIARAIATRAEILIFDEPTAALADREASKLFEFIKTFCKGGGAVFYISHRLDEILALASRITILRDGKRVCELDPGSTAKGEMVRYMAGREVMFSENRNRSGGTRGTPDTVLAVDGLSRRGEFSDISFKLHRGEVLGIAGLVGSGRTEIGRCLFGVTKADSGTIQVFNETVRFNNPTEAINRGVVYVPEERKQDGIFPLLSIAENITQPSHGKFSRFLTMRFPEMVREVKRLIGELGIKVGHVDDPITSLSGGNQQKVILARWLMRQCKILFLDEPTRGIDVKAKAEIQEQLLELADTGMSIIYVSSELQEVLDVSDRILVIHEGCLKGVVKASGATQESLLHLAMN